jgi:hypothetical protein
MPDNAGMSVEDYFDANIARIESCPSANACLQKTMVRHAMAERPKPSFRQLIASAWTN